MVKNTVKLESRFSLDKLFRSKKLLLKLKSLAYAKFDESVDAHVNLGIDASKGDQVVRGSLVLPHAKGAAATCACFC